MSKPVITIGICARNAQATIRQALTSISEQDFSHDLMELIFVDDGSDDNTLQIAKGTTSKTDIETKIFSGQWQGLGKARNTILYHARGKYILWLDSDEVIAKNFVSKQVNLMNNSPKAGIALGQIIFRTNESYVLFLDLIPYCLSCVKGDWSYPSKVPGTGGATYRVIAAKEAGGFNEKIVGTGEDIDLAARMMKNGWSIVQSSASFNETHSEMTTLWQLWQKYSKDGLHGRRLYKTRNFFSFYRVNPISSFIAGICCLPGALRMTKRKTVLLLPFHFAFKMTAWFFGFSKQ